MSIIQTNGIDLKLDVALVIFRTVMFFEALYPEPRSFVLNPET